MKFDFGNVDLDDNKVRRKYFHRITKRTNEFILCKKKRESEKGRDIFK